MSNIIFLEFFNKKNFPPGKWSNEPDLCQWVHTGLSCLVVRDMSLGVWKGFVGIESTHTFYGKSIEDVLKSPETLEIFLAVYGGVCSAGKLIPKYRDYDKNLWWLGIETSHGGDYMPLLKLEPDMINLSSGQTYKDFSFIRKETNKLAEYVSRII